MKSTMHDKNVNFIDNSLSKNIEVQRIPYVCPSISMLSSSPKIDGTHPNYHNDGFSGGGNAS